MALSELETFPETAEAGPAYRLSQTLELSSTKRIPFNTIKRIVGDYYKVTDAELMSKSRKRDIARPRQIIAFLAREYTLFSYPWIAQKLGDRDHTTILHGFNKINALKDTDETIKRDLVALRGLLASAPAPSPKSVLSAPN